MKTAILAIGAALLFAATAARAEEPKLAEPLKWVRVAGATCAAVHDELGLLVVGRQDGDVGKLALMSIDDQGVVNEDNTKSITLPRHESLAAVPHRPLAVAFHPTLPMLYVWQDVRGTDAKEAVDEHFNHLIIYRLTAEGGEEAGAYCRGREYAKNQAAASLAVSGDGQRLFIPNMIGRRAAEEHGAIGYFDLDESGMLVPIPVPIPGTLDGFGVSKFDLRHDPISIYVAGRRRSDRHWRWISQLPIATGLIAPTRRAVLFGSRSGLAVWDTEDRRQELSEVMVRGVSETYLGSHPTLPMVYGATRRNTVLAMRHAQGFPTLLPEVRTVPDASLRSEPAVFHGRQNGLAVIGDRRVHLLGLNESGGFSDVIESVGSPDGAIIRAMAGSSKPDRLFVVVDPPQ